MFEANIIQKIVIIALPLLFAITVHEAAHGWVANRLGDPTARMLGRLTLNPVKHIDPFGTVLLPLILLLMQSPFFIGWAKPVPITVQNLRNPRQDMAWVALAGPGSNLLMALIWALITRLGIVAYGYNLDWLATPVINMGVVGVGINVLLMLFNLFPIPPLDGGRVLVSLLPGPMSWKLSRVEPYGIYIVLALFIFGGGQWLMAAVRGMSALIGAGFGLPSGFFY